MSAELRELAELFSLRRREYLTAKETEGIRLLCALKETPGLTRISRKTYAKEHCGDEYPFGYIFCPCGSGACVPLERRRNKEGRGEYFCRCCDTNRDYVLDDEACALWKVDYPALAHLIGTQLHCDMLNGREIFPGMWALGRCKTSVSGQINRHFYLASRLTAHVMHEFEGLDHAILLVAGKFKQVTDPVGKRIFLLEEALCLEERRLSLNMPLLSSALFEERAIKGRRKESSIPERVERLKRIVHKWLLKAGRYYAEKETESSRKVRGNTLRRPSVKKLTAEYCRVHRDDMVSEDTIRDLVSMKKAGKAADDPAFVLRELWAAANSEEKIIRYYEGYMQRKISGTARNTGLDDPAGIYSADFDDYNEEQMREFLETDGVSVRHSP